jgi:glycine dehydrogenase
VAHECILDLRPLKDATGIVAEDVAKRLIDYGFHAPTLSFPVAGTLMVEPTESESLHELDRFIDAMIADPRGDPPDRAAAPGPRRQPAQARAAHRRRRCCRRVDPRLPRELAVFPLATLKQQKYWPPVARVDNVYGDKNVMCSLHPAASSRS